MPKQRHCDTDKPAWGKGACKDPEGVVATLIRICRHVINSPGRVEKPVLAPLLRTVVHLCF